MSAPSIGEAVARYVRAEAAYDEFADWWGPTHPTSERLAAERDDASDEVDAAVKRAIRKHALDGEHL